MWALIQDNTVVETTDVDPNGRFHPDLNWRACSEQVQPGWLFKEGLFSEKVDVLEERVIIERLWRATELGTRQWLRDRHRDELDLGRPTTLSNEQFVELLAYLQTLRDWPLAQDFPDRAKRPVAPPWIAEQTQ
ncbi:MAG TPA: hypothetical protein VG536_05075 [Pseudomonas sp.]|nr:hypothetical protein [Pseudomonas sp.]